MINLNSTEIKRTATQFLREFWFSFVIAGIWIYLVPQETDQSWKTQLSSYFATVFFISWFTGNLNRIKKQNQQFDKFDGLLKSLEEKTTEIIGHSTGGDTFCQVLGMPFPRQNKVILDLIIMNRGKFPAYNVKIMITGSNLKTEQIQIGNIGLDDRIQIKTLEYESEISLTFVIYTLTGVYYQEYSSKYLNHIYYSATKLIGNGKILVYENTRPDLFPNITND